VEQDPVRWGMIGCGDVAEVKSGPAFAKARGSALLAVMRRDRSKAEDFARRHGVPRVHSTAEELIADPDVDAIYIATPPDSHGDLAYRVAAARKPCLVEKPMARSYRECVRILEAFERAAVPFWVAFYRRALPRFLMIRDILRAGTLGRVTSASVDVREPLATGDAARAWRFNRSIAGAGLFFDKGSHCIDILDFLIGPVEYAHGIAVNSGRTYEVEDVTVAVLRMPGPVLATGTWNFNADETSDRLILTAENGTICTSLFSDSDVVVRTRDRETVHEIRNPPHVHQPLIQTIVDELRGSGRCEPTGESGARASRVLDVCLGREPGEIDWRPPAAQALSSHPGA
jgi:1,5-anhydro-D-fructose reductase (1,5-anhydro-D-mannitol-forming)